MGGGSIVVPIHSDPYRRQMVMMRHVTPGEGDHLLAAGREGGRVVSGAMVQALTHDLLTGVRAPAGGRGDVYNIAMEVT